MLISKSVCIDRSQIDKFIFVLGGGYVLTLFKEPEFNIIRIKSYISSKMPDVDILSDTEEKLMLKLPPDKCHLYENLLKGLEEQDWKIKQIILTEIPVEKLFEK